MSNPFGTMAISCTWRNNQERKKTACRVVVSYTDCHTTGPSDLLLFGNGRDGPHNSMRKLQRCGHGHRRGVWLARKHLRLILAGSRTGHHWQALYHLYKLQKPPPGHAGLARALTGGRVALGSVGLRQP